MVLSPCKPARAPAAGDSSGGGGGGSLLTVGCRISAAGQCPDGCCCTSGWPLGAAAERRWSWAADRAGAAGCCHAAAFFIASTMFGARLTAGRPCLFTGRVCNSLCMVTLGRRHTHCGIAVDFQQSRIAPKLSRAVTARPGVQRRCPANPPPSGGSQQDCARCHRERKQPRSLLNRRRRTLAQAAAAAVAAAAAAVWLGD